MPNQSKIKNKEYKNWVKGALGLGYLQEGLFPFTDRVVKTEHAKIVQQYTSCTNCSIENILPEHAGGNSCIQKNKGKCNCKMKKNRNCPTCSKIYDDIVKQHRFREPNWVPDCSIWYNDHWQFAKCFMTTTNKGSNTTAKETDASGLLSIIINGEFFQSELQCTIDGKVDIFSQVRKNRNEILHNATLEMTDKQVTSYLDSMIKILEDKKKLSSDKSAQIAVQKLKELLKKDLNITLSEEVDLHETVLKAVREAKEQAKEERAKAKEASTEVFEREIKNLKKGHKDHEERLIAVENKQTDFEWKLQELEKRVNNFETAEKNLEARIKDLKKQELQKHLSDQYKRHNVKTWISPLMTQENDINISDVYVPPRMVVRENKVDEDGHTNTPGEDKQGKEKHIEKYRDLFGTEDKRNSNIFIIGDVGTGKSSFCKMMIQNWCSSIHQRRNSESGAMEEEAINEHDIHEMDRFNFLFYIPLRKAGEGTDGIINMIKAQLPIKYQALVDDIFTNDPGRVLIIADGLDEWTPIKGYGLPQYSQASGSTILTTSRPSSRGILNLKSSESDLKVTLLGLMKYSVKPMIEKYIYVLDKTSDVEAIKSKIFNSQFKDMHNAPMLLQQIIWLSWKGYDIKQSKSSIYIHIVNAVLGWYWEKMGQNPQLEKQTFKELVLPKSFNKFRRCKDSKELLFRLGKIAFDAYITGTESSLVFGRDRLEQLDISPKEIETIVQTGILTEVNRTDPTQEKTRLSFIHTSYAEFFAALFICSRYSFKITEADSLVSPLALLESLIAVTPETSVTEILRLENVLLMICGLHPGHTETVCECIYMLTRKGENMDEVKYNEVKSQIHDLTFNCISEHNSVDPETTIKCKLRHIYRKRCFDEILLTSYLDPKSIETCWIGSFTLFYEKYLLLSSLLSQAVSLQTLVLRGIFFLSSKCDGPTIDLRNNRELQSLEFDGSFLSVSNINYTCLQSYCISYCKLSHEQYSLLTTCLSQAVSLRTLKIIFIDCTTKDCEGHTIDLAHHRELQCIELLGRSLSIDAINHTCLQSFCFSNHKMSHEQCSLLTSYLSLAVSLQTLDIQYIKCTTEDCEGHTIDLKHHRELQSIELSESSISFHDIDHTCLQSYCITFCELSHEQYSLLTSCLSQAVSLRTLKLNYIKCTTEDCEGHVIDLTHHRDLQTIELSGIGDRSMNHTCIQSCSISVSDINQTCLRSCRIRYCKLSHEQCSLLISCLSQASSLRTLEIDNITCTKEDCEGHSFGSIGLTNHKLLQLVKITQYEASDSDLYRTVLRREKSPTGGYHESHSMQLVNSTW